MRTKQERAKASSGREPAAVRRTSSDENTAADVTVHPTSAQGLLARLARAEERFADIARLVSDWIWETDREFRFNFVSGRVTELLRLHPRELQGVGLFEFGTFLPSEQSGTAPPDPGLRSPFKDAPYRVRTREGTERLFLLSGLPVFNDQTGAFTGFRGTARDVTDELAARADASRSQTRLKDAVESISEGFVLYDAQARLLLCNRRFREYWYAIAHRLVPGAPLSTLLRAGTRLVARPSPRKLIGSEMRERTRSEAGLELQLKDGRWLRISDRLTSDGAIVSIHTDITAAKQREEALRNAKNAAEAASRAKSAFLANVSHELRTPLNAIIGFSEMMRDKVLGPIGNPQYEGYVESVVDSAHHLLGLINDILDVAKAEAGKLELEETEVDLASVFASVERLVRDQAHRRQLRLTVASPESLPLLHADERRLKQILINLLSNAIKFTEPGGSVEALAGLDPDGQLSVAVSDTGIGIAPEDIPEALAPFGQVDNRLSRKFLGTGLGLPLTRALVELHGGNLVLASAPGVGTTVTVRFPAVRVKHPAPAEPTPA
jgi:PAS domain S-box-containing protein